MPYNGSGSFSPPAADFPAVPGTVIESTKFNNVINDVAAGLSNALTKDGQTTATGNQPMGGYRHMSVGDAVNVTEYGKVSQIQNSSYSTLSSVAGTNTITASLTPAPAAYANNQRFMFIAANTNTGAVTININSLGAKAIKKLGTQALVSGEIVAGRFIEIIYDGTNFQLVGGASGSSSDYVFLSTSDHLSITPGTGDAGRFKYLDFFSGYQSGWGGNAYTDDDGTTWKRYRATGANGAMYIRNTGDQFLGLYDASATAQDGIITWSTIFTIDPTAFTYMGNAVWHSGNDGAGSALDADTVDGYQAAALAKTANNLGDLASAATARTNLGLGFLSTATSSYTSSGVQSVTGSYYYPSAGIYNFVGSHANLVLQIQTSSGWCTVNPWGVAGLVICDGTNQRFYTYDSGTYSLAWQKFA